MTRSNFDRNRGLRLPSMMERIRAFERQAEIAAHGIKLLRDDRIVVDIFGDGAINRGPFLEGLNWAAVFGLPVPFVCENNEWSATTRTSDMTAGRGAGSGSV